MYRPALISIMRAPVFLLMLILLQHPTISGAQVITSPPQPPPSSPTPPTPQVSSPSSAPQGVVANILAKLDPVLIRRLWDISGRSRVIVRARNDVPIAAVAFLVSQLGGTIGRDLPIIHGEVADVPNLSVLVLAASPGVEHISLDRTTRGTLERTGPTIGSTAVREEWGYDGSGVGVAVIDSGLTSWHDDLTQGGIPGSQRVDQFVDLVGGQSMPYDDYGHGTHVAGIIVGNGFDSGGARSGIAPAARLVVLKVLDGAGRGNISDVIAALGYVIDNKDRFGIRIVNLSLGAPVTESYNVDPLTLAAKRVVEQGIVVVAAAGNAGRNAQGGVQYGSILAPGNAPWVLTAGASSHNGTIDRSDDTVAAFSSRGPTAVDQTAKPDVVAPGVGIYSLSDPQSTLYTSKSQFLLPGTAATSYLPYLSLSGTSQSTPVVAGTVALMLQANPSLTPNAVKAILEYTAQVYPGYSALDQGAGFLNARGAVELARFFWTAPTSVYSPPTDWGRQLIWGTHRVQGGLIQPDGNAWPTNVTWANATAPDRQPVRWGVTCSTVDCESTGTWSTWGTTCLDPQCNAVVWGDVRSDNVVWGSTCGGADCPPSTPVSGAPVRSSSMDDDTVVWGNTDDSEPVIWPN